MKLFALALAVAATLVGCGYSNPNPSSGAVAGEVQVTPTPAPGSDSFSTGLNLPQIKLPDGLQYADVKVGTGPPVVQGDTVSVQYTGWLTNGTKFDSSRDRGQAFSTPIGSGNVIPGWDEGIPGMRVGGIRRLLIPPALGYGANPPSGGPIPANATLVFLVQLVSITAIAPSPSPSP
ncbi:MAG TPA: FKBP-type peptidyl-prolyl cis-trans isomerase [Candidatus Nitrosotalea sp.]|nr:FKBP-type peptidyl-prolyl cis-trans isomerase [Candidatus Nitrosotalea sp.]